MSILSGRQLLIIGRFAVRVFARFWRFSGANLPTRLHELNIEIVIVESVWDL